MYVVIFVFRSPIYSQGDIEFSYKPAQVRCQLFHNGEKEAKVANNQKDEQEKSKKRKLETNTLVVVDTNEPIAKHTKLDEQANSNPVRLNCLWIFVFSSVRFWCKF